MATSLLRPLIWLLLPLLVLMALALTGARVLMGSVDQYRDQFQHFLTQQTGYEVTLGQLHGQWRYLSPQLSVDQLTLSVDSSPLLTLQRLEVELDLPRSVWYRVPVVRRLLLDGGEVTINEDADGQWRLPGLSPVVNSDAQTERRGSLDLAGWLWLQQRLTVRDLAVNLAFQGSDIAHDVGLIKNGDETESGVEAEAAPTDDSASPQTKRLRLNADWQRRGAQRLQVELQTDSGDALTLQAQASGRPGSTQFKADYYLQASLGSDRLLQPLLALLPDSQRFAFRVLEFDAHAWGQLRGANDHRLKAELSLPVLDGLVADRAVHLADVSGQLQLQQQAGGWRAMASSLKGQWDQRALGLQQVMLVGDGRQLRHVAIPQLSLAAGWQHLTVGGLLPVDLAERLAPLDPRGSLENLLLTLNSAEESPRFELLADLNEVAIGAWVGAPEARGINGRISVSDQHGRVDLSSDDFWLYFPQLYKQGWQFNGAGGVISWQRDEATVRVESERLTLADSDVSASGRFLVEIPTIDHPELDGRLILMIGMQNSNAAVAPRFVPDKILHPGLYSWLDTALEAGHLRYGGLIYDAPLRREAGEPHQGSLQMFFDSTATRLRYQPRWPAIEDADAFTLIRNTEVLVQVPNGRLYDQTRIGAAEVYLPADSHRLQVRAQMEGPAADGRLALLESPIGQWLGEEFERWQLSGQLATTLNLGIDMDAIERSQIRVDTQVSGGEYWSENLNLRITDIEGEIRYHEQHGLTADALSGRLFGLPLAAQIDTQGQGGQASTHIRGQGRVALGAVRDWLSLPLLDALQGETDYAFELRICGYRPGCSGLNISSDLVGVALEAPQPFAKQAADPSPFRLDLALTPDQQWLSIDTAGIDALLALKQGALLGGNVVFGEHQRPLPRRVDGIAIRGHVATLELEAWQTFVEQRFLNGESLFRAWGGDEASDDTVQQGAAIRVIDLHAEQATLGDHQLRRAHAMLQEGDTGWSLAVNSDEVIGQWQFAVGEHPHQVHLQRLYLPAAAAAALPSDSQAPPLPEVKVDPWQSYRPQIFPAAEVVIEDLRRGDKAYGRWQFTLDPVADGARFDAVKGQINGLDVDGALVWLYRDGQHRTELNLEAVTADIGAVMEGWGSARSMSTEQAEVEAHIDWNGSPSGFDWAILNGEARIHAERGRLFDTGDRAVVKLFSLFNMNTLLRRLSLDFDDLSAQGTFFDEINAQLALRDGIASLTEPATLISPTHDIEVEGDIDLGQEFFDLQLLVKLPVADNLPIAAALLATPAVAGAVFLVERLIGKSLKRFTSVRYQLTGPWREPVMEPLRRPANTNPPTLPLDSEL